MKITIRDHECLGTLNGRGCTHTIVYAYIWLIWHIYPNIRTCLIFDYTYISFIVRETGDPWINFFHACSHQVFRQFCFSVFLLVFMISKDRLLLDLVWLRRIISTEFLRTSLLHHERRRCDVAGLKWCGKRRTSNSHVQHYVFCPHRMRQFLMTVWAYLLPWFLHVPFTLLDMLFQNTSCFNGNLLANPNSTTTLWLETRLRDSRTQDLLDGWWDLAKGLEPKFWGQGPRCGFHAIPAIAHGLLDDVSKLSMTMLE